LRHGLKNCSGTALQRNGAACGRGVYLSSTPSYSAKYAQGGGIMGVCEIRGAYNTSASILCVDEKDVILRYLLVGKKFKGITLSAFGKNKTTEAIGNRRLKLEFDELINGAAEAIGCIVGVRDDDLSIWDIIMTDFGDDAPITQDLKQYGILSVAVEIRFPTTGEKYPIKPPFVRIVSPRFQFHTGHITVGGSFCIELLTPQGWSPVYKIESLLVTLKSMILSGGARLDPQKWNVPYTLEESRTAFHRVAKQHRWI
jgi:ubiquitin-protein ligase